jgi:hypothetical protein
MDKPLAPYFRTRAGFAVLSLCFAAAFACTVPLPHAAPTSTTALCTTDTECMALCRPDDPNCDGGPADTPDECREDMELDQCLPYEQARLCAQDADHCEG